MANSLPHLSPLNRIYLDDLIRLARKAEKKGAGGNLTPGEVKREVSDRKRLHKAGYSDEQIDNAITAALGTPHDVSFGVQDLTFDPKTGAKILGKGLTQAGAVVKFIGNLTDPHTWLRVAYIILGGVLFLGGLGLLLKELARVKIAGSLNPVTNLKTVAKTAKGVVA
jgi:hypothetical protein